jgi:hypothetical protein
MIAGEFVVLNAFSCTSITCMCLAMTIGTVLMADNLKLYASYKRFKYVVAVSKGLSLSTSCTIELKPKTFILSVQFPL